MSGTKKSILFFASFFITIFFMSIVGVIFRPFLENIDDYTYYNIVSPILYTIYLIFFMIIESTIRKIYTKRFLNESTILFKVKTNGFNLSVRLIIYLAIVLIYFISLFRDFSIKSISIPRIILFILSFLIIEFILRISNKSIYGYFTRDYIIISGWDFRLSLPIIYGTNVHNDSDVYTYNDIKDYFIFTDYIELYLIADQGKLVFDIDSELSRKFVGILNQKKIPMKKFN
ncbi:hypothetical protein [Senegalia massiliensis]|uniref:hypothetical protein n=1 Tax=Senegalia massiliensis TaxID=1720316 RepID=UPI001031B7E1|nr:hypothetical protein [Senegalia massiliensis]